MSDQDLATLKARLETESSVDVDREIELADAAGVVHAVVQKTIYVARKDVYQLRVQQEPGSGRH